MSYIIKHDLETPILCLFSIFHFFYLDQGLINGEVVIRNIFIVIICRLFWQVRNSAYYRGICAIGLGRFYFEGDWRRSFCNKNTIRYIILLYSPRHTRQPTVHWKKIRIKMISLFYTVKNSNTICVLSWYIHSIWRFWSHLAVYNYIL